MDWNSLKPEKNPLFIRVVSWVASMLVGIWVFGSLYYLFQAPAPITFQRFGAFGVGAFLTHYVFIRFTWRRRSESVSSMQSAAFVGLISAKSGHSELDAAKQTVYDCNKAHAVFVQEEARSNVIEGALLLLTTMQWGFGDLFAERVINALL